MRTLAVGIALFLAAAVLAQDEARPTPAQAADKVLAAKDAAALKALALVDNPDPWLVADELCARGEHDAAAAFAKAAPRKDVERLADYVASRRGKAPDAEARAALAAANTAFSQRDLAAAMKALDGAPAPAAHPVAAIRLMFGRGLALAGANRLAGSAEAFLAAAARAKKLGWLSRAAEAFYQAGAVASRRADFNAARAAWEAKLEVETARGNRVDVAGTLVNIGNIFANAGDPARAADYYERGVREAEAIGYRPFAATAHLNLGRTLNARAEHTKALVHLERALALYGQVGDRAAMAQTLEFIGLTHASLSNDKEALVHLERGLAMQESLDNRAGIARALVNIGIRHQSFGDNTKALAYMERGLARLREVGDRPGVARTLGSIGLLQQAIGAAPQALAYLERALELLEELRDRPGVADTLVNIGLVNRSLGDYQKALANLRRALALQEQLRNRTGIVFALVNIGQVYQALGDHRKGLVYHERALKVRAGEGNREAVAAAFANIGRIHQNVGDFPRALNSLARSLQLFERLGDRAGVADSLGSIGLIHDTLGDYPKALACQQRVLELLGDLGDRAGVAATLVNIGNVHLNFGDHAKALDSYERGLREAEAIGHRQWAANAIASIAIVHDTRADYAKALAYHERALERLAALGDRAGAAQTIANIGNVHRSLGDYPKAVAHYERALAETDALGVRDNVVCHLGLAKTRLALDEPAEAAASARRAVAVLGQLAAGLAEEQGARAREQFASVFDVGTQAGLALNDPDEVCFFVESGRAATLLEVLGGRDALRAVAVPEELRAEEAKARVEESRAAARYAEAREQRKRRAIKETRRKLDAAREKVADVIARIQREAKAGASVAYPKADSLAEIRARVRDGEALVLYATAGEELVALVVTREGGRIVRLGAQAAIDGAIKDMEALRKLVVAPLNLGSGTKRVLVSPTGALSYVPFVQLLGDREVVYVPSGTTLGVLLDERDKRGEGVLALGDPDYRGKTLTRLPATRLEAEAIGDVTLLGAGATETALVQAVGSRSRWRALHLACHGLVDPERPLRSSLALSGGDFLTTREVLQLKVPADLVVLSACETGKGKIYHAEGVVGFVRAFMFAGAPRVLVSLWKVDDEATRALMVKFYELREKQPTATALRRAQEFVRGHEKWKQPRYWAAWQLWGLGD